MLPLEIAPCTDIELQAPGDAITAVAFHPSDPERLLASAWDGVSSREQVRNLDTLTNISSIRQSIFIRTPHHRILLQSRSLHLLGHLLLMYAGEPADLTRYTAVALIEMSSSECTK